MVVLSIIGTILLWVLIVFAGIVGLVLLLALVVWVAPIKYHADISAKKEGENKLVTDVQAKGRWLYGLVRFVVDGNDVRVKFLWFNLKRKETRTESREPRTKNQEPRTKNQDCRDGRPRSSVAGTKKENPEKEGFFTRIKNKIIGYKEMYDSIVNHPDRAAIQPLLIDLVKRLLRRLKPRVFRVDGVIGFDSPDKTGMAIGVICAVRGITSFNINVDGDFDNQIINLNAHITDKLRLYQIAYPIIRLCLRKKVRPIVFGFLGR